MVEKYMLYKVPDFIRKNEKGEINFDKSLMKIRELMEAASYHKEHNILIDIRESETKLNFIDSLLLALEFAKYKDIFKNKIAFLVPREGERIARAEYVKKSMVRVKGFQMEYFTDYEKAIDWFSIIEKH